jgi:hypothetical protein
MRFRTLSVGLLYLPRRKVNGSNRAKDLIEALEKKGEGPCCPGLEGGTMAEGYCVKCKEKREMKDAQEVEMKNKRKALKGTCEKCGTKMFKIVGKS